MDLRKPLVTNEIYHVYNRTIAKENVFHSLGNIQHTLALVDYYRYHHSKRFSHYRVLPRLFQLNYFQTIKKEQPIISIYSYCFMPNHFHFLLKQNTNGGIVEFIRNFQISYAKYYNLIQKRVGGLFQDRFKAKRLVSPEELIHVARYIHLNLVTSKIISTDQLDSSPFSSYQSYTHLELRRFVEVELLMSHFSTLDRLIKFTKEQVGYQRTLKIIKDNLANKANSTS